MVDYPHSHEGWVKGRTGSSNSSHTRACAHTTYPRHINANLMSLKHKLIISLIHRILSYYKGRGKVSPVTKHHTRGYESKAPCILQLGTQWR